MSADTEKSTLPPSQTEGGNAPDADEVAPEPATESGVDSSAGGDADATTSGRANLSDGQDVEPSVKVVEPSVSDAKKADAAMNPAQAVQDYAETKRA
jgi:hypothetical protein